VCVRRPGSRLIVNGVCLAAILAGSLYGCATYHPEPLEPAKVAQRFESRSLSNAGICEWKCCNFEDSDGELPEKNWSGRSQAARSNSLSMN
jgi:hypothetical protein